MCGLSAAWDISGVLTRPTVLFKRDVLSVYEKVFCFADGAIAKHDSGFRVRREVSIAGVLWVYLIIFRSIHGKLLCLHFRPHRP